MGNVIAENVREAFLALRADARSVLRLAALPSVLIVAEELLPTTNRLVAVVAGLLSLVAYIVLAVRIHRHILLPDAEKGRPATAMLYVRFGIWVVSFSVMGFVFFVPVLFSGADSVYLLLLAMVPMSYFGARLSLALPDSALGHSSWLATVWGWSTANGWKLAAVLFLPPLLINILVILATLGAPKDLRELLIAIASIPVLIFDVALLSCAYRGLTRLGRT